MQVHLRARIKYEQYGIDVKSINCTKQKRMLTADQVRVEQRVNTSLARITIALQAGTQVPVS